MKLIMLYCLENRILIFLSNLKLFFNIKFNIFYCLIYVLRKLVSKIKFFIVKKALPLIYLFKVK